MVGEFKNSGLNPEQEDRSVKLSKISGMSFVFSGELENLSRTRAKQLLTAAGGKWSSSVSKNTDFLVAGINPGSKYRKAKELGLKIISQKQFLAFL